MPSRSEKQRRAAGTALAAMRGDMPRSKLKGAALSMAQMTEAQLRDFAKKRKHKGMMA